VARNHERKCDLLVLAGHNTPEEILDHDRILILPTTVVSMQVYCLLAQPMVYKEVVKHADDGVGALPHVDSFIDQVIDLPGNLYHFLITL